MSNNLGLFLLFSILATGLIISPAYAQEPSTNGTESSVNATETITMAESSNSTASEDEMMETEDEMMETEDEMMETEDEMMETEDEMMETETITTIPSPLKQIKEGTLPESVVCKEGLGLVFKLNGQPACVKTTSIEKLTAWGWIR